MQAWPMMVSVLADDRHRPIMGDLCYVYTPAAHHHFDYFLRNIDQISIELWSPSKLCYNYFSVVNNDQTHVDDIVIICLIRYN